MTPQKTSGCLKATLYSIIFGHNTPAGKRFDLILIITIVFSVIIVILDSIPALDDGFTVYFRAIEWILTIFFYRRVFFTYLLLA